MWFSIWHMSVSCIRNFGNGSLEKWIKYLYFYCRVNAESFINRTVEKVKKKWADMQSLTKKKESERRRAMKLTGGGPPSGIYFKEWENLVNIEMIKYLNRNWELCGFFFNSWNRTLARELSLKIIYKCKTCIISKFNYAKWIILIESFHSHSWLVFTF